MNAGAVLWNDARRMAVAVLLCGCAALLSPARAVQAPTQMEYIGNQSVADDFWYLGEQRKLFLKAESALRHGRITRFRRLKDQLEGYPLYPYLEYADLTGRLRRAEAGEIEAFLERYRDTPLASRLRSVWLKRLAEHGYWAQFLRVYEHSDDAASRCHWLRALINTGDEEAAMREVEALWLVGRSQPSACDPVFAAWRGSGYLSRDLVWRRIELAMREGRPSLASYLARFLDAEERPLVEEWQRVRQQPSRMQRTARLDGDPEIIEAMLVYGMERLARRRPERAVDTWEPLRTEFAFSQASIARVHRRIGLSFAYAHEPESLYWLNAIPEEHVDERTREWRILSSLRHTEWHRALEHMLAINHGEAPSERWSYWTARALEALDWHEDAESLYAGLARERSYYGFLAADRLDLDYNLTHIALIYEKREMRLLAAQPGAMRARELHSLGRFVQARREWRTFIADMSDDELARAAKLAHEWGWHGRAILTVARTRFLDDLELRFPLAYQDGVLEQAEARRLDPAWMYAIVRQESAFIPDARSPAGALGLMQIMPGTGRKIGRHLNRPLKSRQQLLETDTSLLFGSSYLRSLLDSLDDHPVLAAAAYNAGPHRVERWRPDEGYLSADLWIENIPFGETREYLRRVLTYTTIYEQRLGREPMRLSQRLAPIPGRAASRVARADLADSIQ